MGALQLILICATILAACVAGMAISIIVKKNGQFPDGEIGTNPNMQKLGIQCAKQEELVIWRNSGVKNSALEGCSGCALTSLCEAKGEKSC